MGGDCLAGEYWPLLIDWVLIGVRGLLAVDCIGLPPEKEWVYRGLRFTLPRDCGEWLVRVERDPFPDCEVEVEGVPWELLRDWFRFPAPCGPTSPMGLSTWRFPCFKVMEAWWEGDGDLYGGGGGELGRFSNDFWISPTAGSLLSCFGARVLYMCSLGG